MNLLIPMLDHPLARRVGWALLHSIWEGAVVAAVFAIIQLSLRRHSANARYTAGCASLVLLFAAPLITLVCLPMEPGSPLPPHHQTEVIFTRKAIATLVSALPPSRPASFDFAQRLLQVLEDALPWLIQLWAFGVFGLSIRWLYGNRWIKRVVNVEVEPLGPEWLARLHGLSRRLAITRPVRLLKSTLVEVPLVVGWLRPIILLPASALAGLTPDQLDAILVHELAHVRRHDYFVNLFQTLVETLMFYHPAVWWISRCIREEREHCCDDLVVQICGDRVSYVRALVTLEQARGVPEVAFAASGGSLLHRVRRLLGVGRHVGPPSAVEFGGIALVAVGCVLVLTAAWLAICPNMYQAAALIRVLPPLSGKETSEAAPLPASEYFPYLLQTECMVIRSPAVLARVVGTEQPLREDVERDKLSSFDKLARLQKRVTPVRVPGTSLIEIRAVAPEATQAAQVANAVAVAYKEYRRELRSRSFSDSLHTLETRFSENTQKVRRSAEEVERLRMELKVPDVVEDENGGVTMRLTAETLRRIEPLRIESQADYAKQKALLEYLEKVDRTELPDTFQTVGITDAQLLSYLESNSVIDQKLVSLRREFGPEYPEIVKAEALQKDLKNKITERTGSILRGLRAKLDASREGLAAVSNAVLRAQTSALEATSRMQPYFEAKRTLEELERFSAILQAKIAMEKTDEQLPVDLVEVVEEARSPTQPLIPNRSQDLALLGAGLVLILLGFLLTHSSQHPVASISLA